MKIAPISCTENNRLKELFELKILDTCDEIDYDAITTLAARICQTPISLISLLDSDRQWFKSRYGIDARHTPRNVAVCSHAILQDDIFIIEDARLDDRFRNNPLVTNTPNVVFYAGIPLITKNNHALGTLCVIDHQAKTLTQDQIQSLKILARQVVTLFELRLANIKFEEEISAKLRFLNSINHEMRTPLNILNGYIELIEDDAITRKDDTTQESCQYIKTACEQLTSLVKDVVDQTSIEAGQFKIYPKEFNLNALIHDAVTELRKLASQKDMIFKIDYTKIELMVADDQKIKQILMNLLTNAINFGFAGSTVEISMDHLHEDFINIRVTNSSNEIAKHERLKIFDRYYRSNAHGYGQLSGLGLGLPIAKHLAQAQGGDVILESSVNSMTTFVLKLKR